VWGKDAALSKSDQKSSDDLKGKQKATRSVGSNDGAAVKALTQKMEGLASSMNDFMDTLPQKLVEASSNMHHVPGPPPVPSQQISQPSGQPLQPATQQLDQVAFSNRKPFKKDTVCWSCGEKGHLKSSCMTATKQQQVPRSAPIRSCEDKQYRMSRVYVNDTI